MLSLAGAAAVVSLGALASAVALVVALHRLEPEFDPAWRMLSEYSLGKYGWLMRTAFILGGAGVMAAGVALWPTAGVLAAGLPVVALGPIGAAFIDTDPVTTARPEISSRSKVHAALGALFILGFPVAATLAGIGAARSPAGLVLAWAVTVPWAGLAWFLGATFRFGRTRTTGAPDVRVGWPNRFNMLAYVAWAALAGFLILVRAL